MVEVIGRKFVGERISGGEEIDPAAVKAYKRIKSWTESRSVGFDPFGAEQLATLAANIAESTIFELTKGSDCVKGCELSLEELRYAIEETPSNQSFVNLAVVVGMQEAIKAVVKLGRSFGSD